ncbi:hypothetical protein AB0K00_27370 [Dactylosporangium sp. NPDC049525]|uniref:hypothetical protein n=1 Tax=Dactylosporangium sp. NPDC049525 TaxID=3154730 RepID=UPI003417F3BB
MNTARKDLIADAEQLAANAVALIDGVEFGPALVTPVRRVRDQAERVLATVRDPYKVGVIGEYGAGKTLFVSSMLGFLDSLPIGDRPTTGNVTRFRLRPVDDGLTVVTGRRVVFLSRSECETCLADLGQQVRAAGTSHPGLDLLTRKAVDGDPDPLHAWHRFAKALDPSLDRLVRQLVAVSASARQHDAYLGTTRDVSEAQLAQLVQISYDDQRPADPPADPFWLIRQAELAMDVPVRTLDLPGLVLAGAPVRPVDGTGPTEFGAGAVLELWDFPGILNHLSSERDRRLTETLLHDVDTAVVLLKAANPDSVASDELTRLLTAVNGGAIAGVGNVFDSPQAIRLKEPGLDSDDAFRAGLPSVAELLRTANQLVPGEPAFLYAGLVALNRLDPRLVAGRFDARVGIQDQLAGYAHKVAMGLPEDSPLRAMLLPVAEDGGRRRVLTMLGDQLSVHGLRRRAERVERETARLRELLQQLETAVEDAPDAGGALAAQAEYQLVISDLRQVLSRLRAALPKVLSAALATHEPDGGPFATFVAEAAAHRVHRWPEWRQMLGSVRGREVRDGPDTTAELVTPFGASCADAFGAVRAEALRRWEQALLRSATSALTADETLLPRAAAVFAEQQGPWTLLAQPEQWRGLLTNTPAWLLAKVPYETPGPERYAAAFPLRRESRFVWSFPGAYPHDDADPEVLHHKHPGYVIRLRHELVSTGAYLMRSDVDDLRIWAGQVARLFFDRMEQALAAAGPSTTPHGAEEARGNLLDAIRKLRNRSSADSGGDLWSKLGD